MPRRKQDGFQNIRDVTAGRVYPAATVGRITGVNGEDDQATAKTTLVRAIASTALTDSGADRRDNKGKLYWCRTEAPRKPARRCPIQNDAGVR
jgi:hypothetical protein